MVYGQGSAHEFPLYTICVQRDLHRVRAYGLCPITSSAEPKTERGDQRHHSSSLQWSRDKTNELPGYSTTGGQSRA